MPFVDRPLTPGRYLQHRRQAQGRTLADVASRLPTDPRTAEHDRIRHLEMIEADSQPASFSTIVALLGIYDFDLGVLGILELIVQGGEVHAPRLCRICACSDGDACRPSRGGPCHWVGEDLCSSCAPPAPEPARAEALA